MLADELTSKYCRKEDGIVVKTHNIDTELLDQYIKNSGLRITYIHETLGITRQAFDKKRKGVVAFRQSEVYVLCDLLRITDAAEKAKIFYPKC